MGIGLNEEIINKLREENLDNYEKGINTDVPVFYIDGAPFKNSNLKSNVFSSDGRGLRTRKIQENMNDEEEQRMQLMAKMVDVVYDRRKKYDRPISMSSLRGSGTETEEFNLALEKRQLYRDIENQDIGDYKLLDTGNDLTAVFVNPNKKESILAIRGLQPFEDYKDSFQLGEMIVYTFTEGENAESMGMEYKNDRDIVRETFNSAKEKNPDHNMVVTGHSRGGKLTLHLGREKNIEYHAFSPAGNRGDFIDSTPQRGGRLYYHTNDPVSLFHHKGKGITEEQHFEMFNSRIYTHDLSDFYNNKQSSFYKHPVKPEQEQIEQEILIDMELKPDDIPTAEEYVLSDLGVFDDFESNRVGRELVLRPTTELVALSFRKKKEKDLSRKDYNPLTDPKQKNTIGIIRDIPTERKIFNEYIPSVYNDLELKPPKPFKPINFNILDSDKNNKISFDEFKKYFTKLNYDEDIIKDLFNTYDIDGDKNIDREEFDKLIMGL